MTKRKSRPGAGDVIRAMAALKDEPPAGGIPHAEGVVEAPGPGMVVWRVVWETDTKPVLQKGIVVHREHSGYVTSVDDPDSGLPKFTGSYVSRVEWEGFDPRSWNTSRTEDGLIGAKWFTDPLLAVFARMNEAVRAHENARDAMVQAAGRVTAMMMLRESLEPTV